MVADGHVGTAVATRSRRDPPDGELVEATAVPSLQRVITGLQPGNTAAPPVRERESLDRDFMGIACPDAYRVVNSNIIPYDPLVFIQPVPIMPVWPPIIPPVAH